MRAFVLSLVLLASTASAQAPRLALRAAFVPNGFAAVPDTAAMERAALPDGSAIYLGETLQALGVGDLTDASVSFDAFTGAPEISVAMTGDAARSFASLTEARVGETIAVVLNGRVLTAPTINGPIPNGRVQITGQFTVTEAEAVAAAIREATQAGDARATLIRDLRSTIDLSRPDSAALAMRRAAAASDWPTVARILHPDVLRALRADAEDDLVLENGRVRVAEPNLPPPPRPVGAPPPIIEELWIDVRDVLDTEAPGERLEDFSDEQVAALLFAAYRGPKPSVQEVRSVGTVSASADVAYVVLSPVTPTPFAEAGISEASVLEARRVDGRWRVLLPSTGW